MRGTMAAVLAAGVMAVAAAPASAGVLDTLNARGLNRVTYQASGGESNDVLADATGTAVGDQADTVTITDSSAVVTENPQSASCVPMGLHQGRCLGILSGAPFDALEINFDPYEQNPGPARFDVSPGGDLPLALDVIGTPGGDDLTVHDTKSATLYGESGDDHLTVGDAVGSAEVDGGDGDDTISARNGRADQIFCGNGNDTVIADASDIVAADCENVTRG